MAVKSHSLILSNENPGNQDNIDITYIYIKEKMSIHSLSRLLYNGTEEKNFFANYVLLKVHTVSISKLIDVT